MWWRDDPDEITFAKAWRWFVEGALFVTGAFIAAAFFYGMARYMINLFTN